MIILCFYALKVLQTVKLLSVFFLFVFVFVVFFVCVAVFRFHKICIFFIIIQ